MLGISQCTWCPRANRCSDGTDRHRQDWLVKSCTLESVITPVACFIGTKKPTQDPDVYHNVGHDDHDSKHLISPGDHSYHEHHETRNSLTPLQVKHGNSFIPSVFSSVDCSSGNLLSILLMNMMFIMNMSIWSNMKLDFHNRLCLVSGTITMCN
jgi:hypothetical protein